MNAPSDGITGPQIPVIQMHAGKSETGEEAETKVRAMKRKKLAIVGFAPSSYQKAPFHDPSWEVWGLNDLYILPGVTRADRWFEIHLRQEVDISTRDPNHIKWLSERRDLPIYMIRKFPDIPMSIEYPLRDVVRHFADRGVGADYLTNTISFEIALAVYEKDKGINDWEYIGVWGVDMAQGGAYGQPSEYAEQRPSCEFWMGQAAGRGIYVYVPPASDLLKAPGIYGFEGDGSQMRMKIRARSEELHARMNTTRQQIQFLDRNRVGMSGEQMLASLLPLDKTIEEVRAFVQDRMNGLGGAAQQLEGQLQQLNHQLAQLEGAADDCLYWMRKYTLPTFSQEKLTDLERPSAVLDESVLLPSPAPVAAEAPQTASVAAAPISERPDTSAAQVVA